MYLLRIHELFRAANWVIEVGPGMECRESQRQKICCVPLLVLLLVCVGLSRLS